MNQFPPLFRGENIRLTDVRKEDLEVIQRSYDDAAFSRLFDAAPAAPKSRTQLERWLTESQQQDNAYLFAIRFISSALCIGWVELDGILWTMGVAGLSIAIPDSQHQGKGYGMEAMRLLIDFAFYELNLHRLQLTVFDYNTRAVSLYERLGFTLEGRYREFVQRHGQRYDMLLYGLLSHEWRQGDS